MQKAKKKQQKTKTKIINKTKIFRNCLSKIKTVERKHKQRKFCNNKYAFKLLEPLAKATAAGPLWRHQVAC